jgi:hypothetical protein
MRWINKIVNPGAEASAGIIVHRTIDHRDTKMMSCENSSQRCVIHLNTGAGAPQRWTSGQSILSRLLDRHWKPVFD